jgi:hypothetical protein
MQFQIACLTFPACILRFACREKVFLERSIELCFVDNQRSSGVIIAGVQIVSHLVLKKEPNASHMCARIKFHTYDRQYKCISEIMS